MIKSRVDLSTTRQVLAELITPEKHFIWVILIFGASISLLTLAVPVAIQYLINTIVNIGSFRAIGALAGTLFFVLAGYAALSAVRVWIVERYEQHLFARLASEVSYQVLSAPKNHFSDETNAGKSNRYFEILLLQKNMPYLLIDGFALALQTAVGFTLVSFYHPWLLVFNVIVLAVVYGIWRVWANGAKRTAIIRSREKYRTAKWIAELESFSNTSKPHDAERAALIMEEHIKAFIDAQRAHFSFTFPQTVSFLTLYAVGSAALLALGGWLVIQAVLSVGQLVAAELVMASIFLGLSRFSMYLKSYYELYGAADKLAELLYISQSHITHKKPQLDAMREST